MSRLLKVDRHGSGMTCMLADALEIHLSYYIPLPLKLTSLSSSSAEPDLFDIDNPCLLVILAFCMTNILLIGTLLPCLSLTPSLPTFYFTFTSLGWGKRKTTDTYFIIKPILTIRGFHGISNILHRARENTTLRV